MARMPEFLKTHADDEENAYQAERTPPSKTPKAMANSAPTELPPAPVPIDPVEIENSITNADCDPEPNIQPPPIQVPQPQAITDRHELKKARQQALEEEFRDARLNALRSLRNLGCTKRNDREMYFTKLIENKDGVAEKKILFYVTPVGSRILGTAHEKIRTPLPAITDEIANAMLSVAIDKGWRSIKISGTPEFKDEIWIAAAKTGITVQGHTPSDTAVAIFLEWQSHQQKNLIERGVENTPDDPDSPLARAIPDTPEQNQQFSAKLTSLNEAAAQQQQHEAAKEKEERLAQEDTKRLHKIATGKVFSFDPWD